MVDSCPHVCVVLKDDGTGTYVQAFSAMYLSMRAATQAHLTISIIHDRTVSREMLEMLSRVALGEDEFRFIDVTNADFYGFCEKHAVKRFSSAVLWRVFLPEILTDCDKVISCDADLIFLFDIASVWNTPMPDGYCMAAVRRRNPHPVAAYYEAIETDPSHYFRMTMALIDLHAVRNDIRFMEKRTWFIEKRLAEVNKLIPLSEQSLFNYFFSNKCLKLDILVAAVPERLDFSKRTILDIKGWNNDTPLSFFYWAFLLGGPWRGQGKRKFHLLKVEYRIKAFVIRLLARLNFKRNRS